MAKAKADKATGDMPVVVSNLAAPTSQPAEPLTEAQKVERFEKFRAELRKEPTRR